MFTFLQKSIDAVHILFVSGTRCNYVEFRVFVWHSTLPWFNLRTWTIQEVVWYIRGNRFLNGHAWMLSSSHCFTMSSPTFLVAAEYCLRCLDQLLLCIGRAVSIGYHAKWWSGCQAPFTCKYLTANLALMFRRRCVGPLELNFSLCIWLVPWSQQEDWTEKIFRMHQVSNQNVTGCCVSGWHVSLKGTLCNEWQSLLKAHMVQCESPNLSIHQTKTLSVGKVHHPCLSIITDAGSLTNNVRRTHADPESGTSRNNELFNRCFIGDRL